MHNSTVVLKIGGSLLSHVGTETFDWDYAGKVSNLITDLVNSHDYRFLISTGGGATTRKYQQEMSNFVQDQNSIHMLGIAITNMHSEIMRGMLHHVAQPEVVRYAGFDALISGTIKIDFDKGKVVVTSPAQPGRSNDWNAFQMAKLAGAERVVIVKNVAGVFSADPTTHPDAQLQARLNWDQYMDIIGNPTQHLPGANYPVDPITISQARGAGISIIVVGGSDLDNLRRAITNQEFVGTVISD